MLNSNQYLTVVRRVLKLNFYVPGLSIATRMLAAVAGIALLGIAAPAQDEPLDPVAIFNQGQDAHEKRDFAAAVNFYKKAVEIMPEFPEAEYQSGVAYLALGKEGEAEKSFRRAVGLRPDWSLALYSLGSLLVQKGEFAEAERLLQKVIDIAPQNPPALAALTDLRLQTNAAPAVLGELLAKVSILTEKANPTVSLWAARSALESALGKKDDAKRSIAAALAIEPDSPAALLQLASMAVADGDRELANQIVSRLGKGHQTDSLKLLKARVFTLEGKFSDAVNQLDALQRPATGTDLRKKIAVQTATSAAELEKQLEGDPKNPAILGRLCSMYRRDDPAKALAYCRRASEAEPKNIAHAVGFGAALVQARQFEPAVEILRKLILLSPDHATARSNLATALFQLKRYAEAKVELTWLTAAQPKVAGPYLFLAIAHDQLGEYMDAMANYQQYARLADPSENKLDIEKVNLRLPSLVRLIKRK